MISSIVVQFNNGSVVSNLPDVWARLEQEPIPITAEVTNLVDLYQMLAYVKSGKSAISYIYKTCVYAEIKDGSVIVKLNFYVWPSDLDLNYTLSCDVGEISEKELVKEYISKDVIFNGLDKESIEYIFEGDIEPEMPFYDQYGQRIYPTYNVIDNYIKLSLPSYCVFRVNGLASGYKHTVTMTFQKLQDGEVFSIDNLSNTIILSYLNELGEVQTDTLKLEIPKCIEDLLTVCKDGNLPGVLGCAGSRCDEDRRYKVYVNSCNGNVILERWETRL